MEILKTPESAFGDIYEYPFEPHFVNIADGDGGSLRMHYIDVGPRDGKILVFVHGNPTWSYEWRNVIPVMVTQGYRCIAIDLIGTGRSDKPAAMSDYTIARHVEWTRQALFECLDLRDVVFVLHDWGGIIGLRVLAAGMDRVSHTVFCNTGLSVRAPDKPITRMHRRPWILRVFQWWIRYNKGWRFWNTIKRVSVRPLDARAVAGYRSPYPDKRHIAGHRQFTQMLPTRNDNPMLTDNWRALQILKAYDKPLLCLFSDKDMVAPTGYKSVRPLIPGSRDHEPVILKNAGHFLCEDAPQEFAEALATWLAANDGGAKDIQNGEAADVSG